MNSPKQIFFAHCEKASPKEITNKQQIPGECPRKSKKTISAYNGWHRNLMPYYISIYLEYGPCKRLRHLSSWGETPLLYTSYHSEDLEEEKQSGSKLTSSTTVSNLALYQVWVRTNRTKRGGPVSKPWCPSLCILGLTFRQGQEGADVSKSKHKTNHFNRRALWAKSHHLRVKHFHGLYLFLTLILEFCSWGNWGQSKRLVTWPKSHN